LRRASTSVFWITGPAVHRGEIGDSCPFCADQFCADQLVAGSRDGLFVGAYDREAVAVAGPGRIRAPDFTRQEKDVACSLMLMSSPTPIPGVKRVGRDPDKALQAQLTD
jgi:hypothetical protein